MVSNPRQPPLRQPLRSHFRTQKVGGQFSKNKQSIKSTKGKAKEEPKSVIQQEHEYERPSTPPPRSRPTEEGSGPSSISDPPGAFFTPRSPPRTPKPRSRTSTLPDVELLDPVQRSPISVRTDPDNGKLFLLLPSSPNSSKIANTPPSRRLFAEELSSDKTSASTAKPESDQEIFERPLKRSKTDFPEPDAEEDINPFIGGFYTSPKVEKNNQSSFIYPSELSPRFIASKTLPFPSHHATLLALHSAVEYALVVHLASVGTAGSTIENDSTMIAIPHLISFSILRPLVERSSGRKFSKNELARLLWIWGTVSEEDETKLSNKQSSTQRTDIGFTISKAKIRSWDWMLGIRFSPSASSHINREVNLVALWNNGVEERKRIVRERVMDWCLRCLFTWRQSQNGEDEFKDENLHGLGISSELSRDESQSAESADPNIYAKEEIVSEWDNGFPVDRIAPIPTARLPSLEVNSIPSSPSLNTPSPKSPRKTRLDIVREAHQTVIAENEEKLGRKLTLKERIRAKEQANSQGTKRSRDQIDQPNQPFSTSASSLVASARQKSSLSRLQDVAESIYMLFVSSSSSSTSGSGIRFAPHPMQDVIKAITSASKQAMGYHEAKSALHQLSSIAPGFIEVERIGMRDWVKFTGHSQPNRTTLADVRLSIKSEMEKRFS